MKMTRKAFFELVGASMLAVSGEKILKALDSRNSAASAVEKGSAARRKSWAMVVDTRQCLKQEGCTKCLEACNYAHNVPEFNDPNHEVKWIWKEPFENVFAAEQIPYIETALKGQKAPVLCNHCDNPPCVRVCPTGATWKREADGIVMMDWHRCIGCRYCMAACPYGSRSFNWVDPRSHLQVLNPAFPTRTKGVVEKCTFCSERLDQAQKPACVEACPVDALIFGDLSDPQSRVRKLLGSGITLRRRPELGTGPNVYYII